MQSISSIQKLDKLPQGVNPVLGQVPQIDLTGHRVVHEQRMDIPALPPGRVGLTQIDLPTLQQDLQPVPVVRTGLRRGRRKPLPASPLHKRGYKPLTHTR
jgi:hypothetical protein